MTFADQNPNLYWCGRNGNLEPVRGPDDKPVKNAVSMNLSALLVK